MQRFDVRATYREILRAFAELEQPLIVDVARYCEASERTIRRHAPELVALGYLACNGRQGRARRYFITADGRSQL